VRTLVTGGVGFIGSMLTFALLSGGHEVGVVDDMSVGTIDNLHPAAWFRRMSILDDALDDCVAEFAPEVVVHLAAQASVADSIRDPDATHAANVEGTRRVARSARAAGARLVLSASSAAVYGEPEEVPVAEDASKAPANPYGVSKLEAERVLGEELADGAVDFASLRFSNVYGPRQDAAGEGGVVAIFCGHMSAGRPPVVHGDGTQTRDFVFVGDVVAAILEAMHSKERLSAPASDGAAYNIATGSETSIRELLATMRAVTGYLGPSESVESPPGDIARSALDPSKAERVFGWKSAVSLEQGLGATWRWYSSV
jgi:UDP-glucose 4-epimerase